MFEETTTASSATTTKVFTYGTSPISFVLTDSRSSIPASRFFLTDGGGSVRELADDTGAITDRYDYDAFGNLTATSGTTDNAYLYRCEQYDAGLGLYYLRARYMNPDSGRFWNADTYEGSNGDPGSLHRYLYASADPVGMIDPSGNFSLVELEETSAADSTIEKVSIPVIRKVATPVAERTINVPITIAANLYLLSLALPEANRNGDAIIGETTSRVKSARNRMLPTAEIFEWDDDFDRQINATAERNGVPRFDVLVVLNYQWIQSVMARRMTIWDIGLDADRDRSEAGPFYELEQVWTAGYPLKRAVSYPGSEHLP